MVAFGFYCCDYAQFIATPRSPSAETSILLQAGLAPKLRHIPSVYIVLV